MTPSYCVLRLFPLVVSVACPATLLVTRAPAAPSSDPICWLAPPRSRVPRALTIVLLFGLNALALPPKTVAVLLMVVMPVYVLAPVIVVVPLFAVRTAGPLMSLTVPPVEVIVPVRAPLVIVPPASDTELIVWANPPRFTMPPALIVVALLALNALMLPPRSVAVLLTVVAPV